MTTSTVLLVILVFTVSMAGLAIGRLFGRCGAGSGCSAMRRLEGTSCGGCEKGRDADAAAGRTP